MHSRKLVIASTTIILAVGLVYFFWQNAAVLILMLVILAYLKHLLAPIKREVLMFFVSAFVGVASESLAMLGGPWAYSVTSVGNFPMWLPFLWGLAGITGITLYQGVSES